MKKIYFIPILAATINACSASLDTLPENPNAPQKNQKPYSDTALSGKIFGKNWSAKVAVLKPFGTSTDQLALNIYQDVSGDACSTPTTSTPKASLVIPAQYETKEYNFDLYSGTPLVFSEISTGAKNLIADSTFLKIKEITKSGFIASLLSTGTDIDGAISEINGTIEVIDCRKQASFSDWLNLINWYKLYELNGKSVDNLTTIIDANKRMFYNRATQSYVNTLVIPLYISAGANSSSEYLFGPMEGLGISTTETNSLGKTLTYSYHGPITYEGQDINLNLDLSVIVSDGNMTIWYELEVQGHIKKISRTFKLKK